MLMPAARDRAANWRESAVFPEEVGPKMTRSGINSSVPLSIYPRVGSSLVQTLQLLATVQLDQGIHTSKDERLLIVKVLSASRPVAASKRDSEFGRQHGIVEL